MGLDLLLVHVLLVPVGVLDLVPPVFGVVANDLAAVVLVAKVLADGGADEVLGGGGGSGFIKGIIGSIFLLWYICGNKGGDLK